MLLFVAVLAGLLASAAPAHAGPVAAVAAWIGSTIAAGGVLGAVVQMGLGIATSLLSGIIGKAVAGRPSVDVQFEIALGDDTPLTFIAGDYVTAGKRKYVGGWGKDNRYITDVIEVSALPQPGIAAMWVDDEKGNILWDETDTDGTAYNLGHPLTNYADEDLPGKHFIWVRWLDGDQIAADPTLVDLFGGDPDYPWTSQHIGTGKTYAVVTTRWNEDTLTSYPSYLFQPQPLPVYDPRKDSSTGGSGPHRWGNRATYEVSSNPAVIAYNVARGIYYGDEWVFGGKNLPAWRLPRAEWVAAMTACDRAVAIAAGGTEAAYRCGLQISVDMRAADVLEELGRAANMRFAEVGGMLKPLVDLPGASVFSFGDGDITITEGQSYQPFGSLDDTFNALSATYPEPGEKWATKDAPEYIHTEATADDGGRYLPTSIAYGAVPYARQVQRLMRSQMKDFRRFRRHQFWLSPEAYALEPLDMVSWTSERNGYIGKKFTVESVDKSLAMGVLVTIREVDPSDYDWSSDFEYPTVIVTPRPVRPWAQTIEGLTVTAETIRDGAGRDRVPVILVACAGTEVGIRSIHIQARVLGAASAVIDTIRPWGDPFAWYLQNVLPATTYQVRARLLSQRTNLSQWSGWLTVETFDIRLSNLDLRYEEITAEVREDVAELNLWAGGTGDYLRGLRGEIAAIRDGLADVDGAQWLAHENITRELGVQVSTARAEYTERIDVAVSDTAALVVKHETLEAEFDGKVATVITDQLAMAGIDGTLAYYANLVNAAVGLGNSSGASNTLLSRVDDTEDGLVSVGESISETNASVGRISASGLLRINSVAAPTGSQTRIALSAQASASDTSHSAALYLVADSDGTSNAYVVADRFAVAASTAANAARGVPFVIDGGVVYMDEAFIRDLSVNTLKIADNAVTIPVSATASDGITVTGTVAPGETFSDTEFHLISAGLVRTGAPTMIWGTLQIASYVTMGIIELRLYRNFGGDLALLASFPMVSGDRGVQTAGAFSWTDQNTGVGATTYILRAVRGEAGDYTGNPLITLRTICAMHVKK